eukprot:m.60583 g.60583  ORF g.60583 m.60583 type:complete len:100 (+) comp11828_c0_seq1:236-535(+)
MAPADKRVSDPEKMKHYVTMYSSETSNDTFCDIMQAVALFATLAAFLLKYKVAGWVALFASISLVTNTKFKGDKSNWTQILVSILSLVMLYMQPAPEAS